MASAEEIRNTLAVIKNDVKQQLSMLDSVKMELGSAGDRLLAIHTRNQGVMIAGGSLSGGPIALDIERLQQQIYVALRSIEDYERVL